MNLIHVGSGELFSLTADIPGKRANNVTQDVYLPCLFCCEAAAFSVGKEVRALLMGITEADRLTAVSVGSLY